MNIAIDKFSGSQNCFGNHKQNVDDAYLLRLQLYVYVKGLLASSPQNFSYTSARYYLLRLLV